jgi:hypothetical protein
MLRFFFALVGFVGVLGFWMGGFEMVFGLKWNGFRIIVIGG